MANEKRNEMLKQLEECQKEYNDLCSRLGHAFFQTIVNDQATEDLKADGKALVKKAKNLQANLPKEEKEETTDGSGTSPQVEAKAG